MTLAVLELVLRWYREGRGRDLPLWRMIYMPWESISQRGEALRAELLSRVSGLDVAIEDDWSEIGGGSMPGTRVRTAVVAIALAPERVVQVEEALRRAATPVIARVGRGKLLLDLRTVFEDQEPILLDALAAALRQTAD